MDRSPTASPTVTEDCRRTGQDRGLQLPSFFFSGSASAISIFCIGLMSGAAGGLLLGATAVVVLQSLDGLADNRLLMDQLENYMMDYPFKTNRGISQWTNNNYMFNTYISVLVTQLNVLTSTLSLAVGIFIGLSTYALVIKKYSEAVMEKAYVLAGPMCLMAVTATGYILGSVLESLLSITSRIDLTMWIIIPFFSLFCLPILTQFDSPNVLNYLDLIAVWFFTPLTLLLIFIIDFLLTTKLILMVALFPMIGSIKALKETYYVQLTIAPVPLMLIITDVFNIAGQPIVTVHSSTSTNTSSTVPEGIFVGVLTCQMLMVAIGMSLFLSWQRGGADRTWASAARSGTAVLGAIKLALPVLGPGPSIGALMGVAGAVGVSLSAAVAATNDYGQEVDHHGLVGRLGVTVGAAVGAFLSSCAHSGLSGIFMALCAAAITDGPKPLFLFLWTKFPWFLCTITTIVILIWLFFTGTLALALGLTLIVTNSVFILIFKFLYLKCSHQLFR